MDWITLIGLSVALAMDAFSVALATGLALPRLTGRHLFRLGFHFGLFQALMPIIGWYGGQLIYRWIEHFAHWIAFGLLVAIGLHMVHEALHKDDVEEKKHRDPTRGWSLVILSIATSIDALAVGFSLSALGTDIWQPALVIGLMAGVLTLIGMVVGRRIGQVWDKLEIVGGVVLILIGVRILTQSL